MKCTLAAINRLYSLFWNVGQSARPRVVTLAAAITYFAASGTNVALACALEAPIGFTAFSVEHKGVISVALATKDAVKTGRLSALPASPIQRRWLLAGIGRKASLHMEMLSQQGPSGPPVSVLLTQTGAWMRLNDPVFGARYHTVAPAEDELTILLPDTAYSGLLKGTLDVEELGDLEVLQVSGEGDSDYAIKTFSAALQAAKP